MKLTLPSVTAEDRKQYPDHTDGSIQGTKLVKSLPKAQVMSAMRGTRNKVFRAILDAMGHDTNYTWITNTCAERAYDEGWIDTEEFDKYARQ